MEKRKLEAESGEDVYQKRLKMAQALDVYQKRLKKAQASTEQAVTEPSVPQQAITEEVQVKRESRDDDGLSKSRQYAFMFAAPDTASSKDSFQLPRGRSDVPKYQLPGRTRYPTTDVASGDVHAYVHAASTKCVGFSAAGDVWQACVHAASTKHGVLHAT